MITHLPTLLQIVRDGGHVGVLRKRGLEYSQIAQLIQTAIAEGLLQLLDESLELTEKGTRALAEAKRSGGFTGSGGWIVPAEDSRIDRANPNDVYLPGPSWKRE